MGLVEAVMDQLSIRFVLGFVLIALVLRNVLNRLDEHRRIKRLGNYGIRVPCSFPLGRSITRQADCICTM